MCTSLTPESTVKVWVGGHLEARVGLEEAADVGETRVDVLPHVLQLFVLVLLHLGGQASDFSSGSCLQEEPDGFRRLHVQRSPEESISFYTTRHSSSFSMKATGSRGLPAAVSSGRHCLPLGHSRVHRDSTSPGSGTSGTAAETQKDRGTGQTHYVLKRRSDDLIHCLRGRNRLI